VVESVEKHRFLGRVEHVVHRAPQPDDSSGLGLLAPSVDIPREMRRPASRTGRIDHISFGISPWDTDGVKAELDKRGLRAQIDTSSRHLGPDGTYVLDEIHTAAFKSYHTATPNGLNL